MAVQQGNVVAIEYKQEKPRPALVLAVLEPGRARGADGAEHPAVNPFLTLVALTLTAEAREATPVRWTPVPHAEDQPDAPVRWRYAAPEVLVRTPILILEPLEPPA